MNYDYEFVGTEIRKSATFQNYTMNMKINYIIKFCNLKQNYLIILYN